MAFCDYDSPYRDCRVVGISVPKNKPVFDYLLKGKDTTEAIEFISDGKKLAILYREDHINILNAETGKLSRTVEGGPWASDFKFVEDESQAVVASKYGASLVDMSNGKTIRDFYSKTRSETQKFVYQPGSNWFAIFSYDQKLNIYNLADGSTIKTIDVDEYGQSLCISPNGAMLVVSAGESLKVFDTATWDEKFDLSQADDDTKAIAISSDSKWMVTGEWRSSHLRDFDHLVKWDLATGKQTARFRAHVAEVTCIAISPDGEYIASGSNNGMVRIWKTPK